MGQVHLGICELDQLYILVTIADSKSSSGEACGYGQHYGVPQVIHWP